MKTEKRKLIIVLTVVALLAMCLTGCAKNDIENNTGNVTLESFVEKLCSETDVPPYEVIKLDKTNFEFYTFIPYDDGLSAVAADALVNITPHSLVVIHAENGDGKLLAENVLKNVDPNKWLCVGSEAVRVAYTDHYIVLVMSDTKTADAIVENFRAIANDLDGMEMSLLTAGNSRYDN